LGSFISALILHPLTKNEQLSYIESVSQSCQPHSIVISLLKIFILSQKYWDKSYINTDVQIQTLMFKKSNQNRVNHLFESNNMGL